MTDKKAPQSPFDSLKWEPCTKEMGIQRYKRCVADCAASVLKISKEDATRYMKESGVDKLIDDDPVIASHYNAEDWVENIWAYMKRKELMKPK